MAGDHRYRLRLGPHESIGIAPVDGGVEARDGQVVDLDRVVYPLGPHKGPAELAAYLRGAYGQGCLEPLDAAPEASAGPAPARPVAALAQRQRIVAEAALARYESLLFQLEEAGDDLRELGITPPYDVAAGRVVALEQERDELAAKVARLEVLLDVAADVGAAAVEPEPEPEPEPQPEPERAPVVDGDLRDRLLALPRDAILSLARKHGAVYDKVRTKGAGVDHLVQRLGDPGVSADVDALLSEHAEDED